MLHSLEFTKKDECSRSPQHQLLLCIYCLCFSADTGLNQTRAQKLGKVKHFHSPLCCSDGQQCETEGHASKIFHAVFKTSQRFFLSHTCTSELNTFSLSFCSWFLVCVYTSTCTNSGCPLHATLHLHENGFVLRVLWFRLSNSM